MAKVISFINEKGGVGKTTSTNIIAACLKHKNFKVLCVDFDQQGHLSFSFGADNRSKATIYDVIKHKVTARKAIQQTAVTDIIPANDMLKSIEVEFTYAGNEKLLSDCLKSVSHLYDYILIDSPPELGLVSVNALVASDVVFIPCLPDGYSLMGTIRVHETISRVKHSLNDSLTIGGIILLKYYSRQNISRSTDDVLIKVTRMLSIPLLKTKIRNGVLISDVTSVRQQDVFDVCPKDSAVVDFGKLVDELLRRGLI